MKMAKVMLFAADTIPPLEVISLKRYLICNVTFYISDLTFLFMISKEKGLKIQT